ncbi:MAG: hypothetical protein AAF668_02745 [Pseudomonadota bacterium]
MILRSLTKHVRTQNWFAVALDFCIVVFGVFIGIQVSNWNDERHNRSLGDQIRRELISDLQQDVEEAEGTLRIAQLRYSACRDILDHVTSWEPLDEWTTARGRELELRLEEVDQEWSAVDAIAY